jgi:hypothetical protein
MPKPIIRRNTTFARLSFFKQDGVPPLNRIDAYDELALPLPLGEGVATSLVGFEFSKNLGEAAGRITITLKGYKLRGNPIYAGQPWADLIEEGDWWGLDIIKNGTEQGLCFGRIDSVGVDIRSTTGEGAVVVTVSGRDFGYALEDTPLFFNPHVRELDNVVGAQMMTIINTAVGTAAEVITNVIKGYMGGLAVNPLACQHKVPAGLVQGTPLPDGRVKWVDGLDLTSCVQQNLRGKLLTQPMFTPGAQSMWDYLQAWRNPALNEMFVDTVPKPGYPKQACLVVREKPFVNATQGLASPWYSLRTWSIPAELISGMNVSRGLNRINYVSLSGDQLVGLNEEALTTVFLTVADVESVATHGLRRLEEYTRYFDEVKNLGAQIEGQDWLGLIVSWNALNHEFWTGTINLGEMRAEIRPGDRVVVINGPPAQYPAFPSDGKVPQVALSFYVEGVQHRYMTGQAPMATTTLTVSRGYPDAIRALDVAAAANPAKWENLIGTTGSRNDPTKLNTTTPLEDATLEASNAPLELKGESNEIL